LHIEVLHNLYFSPSSISISSQRLWSGWAKGNVWWRREIHTGFWWGNL